MTKTEFFRYCATSEVPVRINWRIIYRELERAVFLYGSWHKCTITEIQLYRPTPGRQHIGMYKNANDKCEKAAKKFERWLKEFLDKPKL